MVRIWLQLGYHMGKRIRRKGNRLAVIKRQAIACHSDIISRGVPRHVHGFGRAAYYPQFARRRGRLHVVKQAYILVVVGRRSIRIGQRVAENIIVLRHIRNGQDVAVSVGIVHADKRGQRHKEQPVVVTI